MGLPSKRRTKTSKKDRASHFALKPKQLIACPNCGAKTRPHVACAHCGTYKGNKVVDTTKRAERVLHNKSQA